MNETPCTRKLAAAALLAVLLMVPVRGAEPVDSSLKWVPADAAFYMASLHNRAQIEAVLNSKAMGRLKKLPAVKSFLEKFQEDAARPDGPLEKYHAFVKDPQNKQLMDLLADMASHEVFVYGGSSFVDTFELARSLVMASLSSTSAQVPAFQQGIVPDEIAPQRAMLKLLAENPKLLAVPDVVVGFKLTDTERALKQLDRLDALIREALKLNTEVKLTYKKMKIAGGDFYHLDIDAKQFPWDELNFRRLEETPGEFEKVRDRLKQLKFTMNLGVRQGYLLVSLGESNAALEKLGKAPALADRDELKPLREHADQRILGISYVSQALKAKMSYRKADIDVMFKSGKDALAESDLPGELKQRLAKNIDELAADLKRYIPEPGAVMSFSCQTPRGLESFTYDWSEQLFLDGSRPLSLLQHLGGDPLFAVVGRSKVDVGSYDLAVKWTKRLHGYFEEFGLPQLGDEEKARYEQFKKIAFPLLARLDKTTRSQLIPALADGESALVIDAKWRSKQWLPDLVPETEQALPLPEVALVWGVSDADLLRKGLESCRQIFNEASAAISKAGGGQVPGFKIQPPETRQLKKGTMYYYRIPPFLDAQVMPNAGLSDKVAVVSFSEKHTERILTARPLQVDGGPLADPKRKLAGAAYVNFAGWIDVLTPWIEVAASQAAEQQGTDEKHLKESLESTRVVLDVLKCMESASTASYFEGKALVTRTELRIRDR